MLSFECHFCHDIFIKLSRFCLCFENTLTSKASPNKNDLVTTEQGMKGVLNSDTIKQLLEESRISDLEMGLNDVRLQILEFISARRFKQHSYQGDL